jgi:hypothetical protein
MIKSSLAYCNHPIRPRTHFECGRARARAEEYWAMLASDLRVSGEFRTICDACLQTLKALPRTGAFAHGESE